MLINRLLWKIFHRIFQQSNKLYHSLFSPVSLTFMPKREKLHREKEFVIIGEIGGWSSNFRNTFKMDGHPWNSQIRDLWTNTRFVIVRTPFKFANTVFAIKYKICESTTLTFVLQLSITRHWHVPNESKNRNLHIYAYVRAILIKLYSTYISV